MKQPSLTVPTERKVTISLEQPEGGKVIHIRPKTPLALKTLAGVPVRRPARLDDRNAFEVIENVKAIGSLVHLMPDRAGTINGSPQALVKGLITNLSDEGPMPKLVRAIQRVRERGELRAKRSILGLPPIEPDLQRLRELGSIIKVGNIQDLALPDWLAGLKVYLNVLTYGDVVIEANGTLVISRFVTSLQAQNFYMHQGAKVVQQSRYLTVTISGELKGDLP